MRVLIDGLHLAHGAKGVGLYTRNVLERLLRPRPHGDDPLEITVLLLEGEPGTDAEGWIERGARVETMPWRNHLGHGFRTLPRAVARHRPDVLWMPYETPLARLNAPFLMICHDIPAELRHAQDVGAGVGRSFFGRWRDRIDDFLLGRTLRRAGRIGSNSRWVAERLVEHFGVDPGRLLATPCAPADDFEALARGVDVEATRRGLGLDAGFVLTFSTGDPRENPRVVPEVFARLLDAGSPLGIVVAGVRPAHHEALEALWNARLASRPGHDRLRFVPFLGPDRRQELAGLYTAATVYLDPSLQEGFGMQVVEAMACGTPVVCSDRGALGEVTAGAARLADPTDPGALADAILALLAEPAACRALAEQGQRRARDFDWETTTTTLLEGLHQLGRTTP